MADRIWPGTRALAAMHLDAGQRVWLVTATPVELALIIARRLGLTGALGTVAESTDGIYTGRLVGEVLHGPAKAHAVRALAAREGLTLRRCTAYSDSANDIPMLSVVGTAVAVNPDSDLRDIARRRQWEIRDFRTGRKAAKIGVPSVLGAGAVAGAVAAGLAYRRRTWTPGPDSYAGAGRSSAGRSCPSRARHSPGPTSSTGLCAPSVLSRTPTQPVAVATSTPYCWPGEWLELRHWARPRARSTAVLTG